MQIDPNMAAGPVGWAAPLQSVTRHGKAQSEHLATFASSEALNNEYRQVPDSRPEAVAKGKALVEHSVYPPPETIRRLANLLAMQFSKSEPAE